MDMSKSSARVMMLVTAALSFLLATFLSSAARAQDDEATNFCWEEWTLCEGSIPCPVTICVDDLVASIICSIDNSCEEDDEIPRPFATRLQYELSKPGGFLTGRRPAAAEDDDPEVVCWEVGDEIVCEELSTILGDCSVNADCAEDGSQSRAPDAVLQQFRVLFDEAAASGSESPWSYPACCESCDCRQGYPCICKGCSDNDGQCGPGFAAATCESDGNGTTCYEDPTVQGCCVFCPPGQPCQHCASADHSTCGALLKADCGLYDDEFVCQPAEAVIPLDISVVAPSAECRRGPYAGAALVCTLPGAAAAE